MLAGAASPTLIAMQKSALVELLRPRVPLRTGSTTSPPRASAASASCTRSAAAASRRPGNHPRDQAHYPLTPICNVHPQASAYTFVTGNVAMERVGPFVVTLLATTRVTPRDQRTCPPRAPTRFRARVHKVRQEYLTERIRTAVALLGCAETVVT